MHNYSVEIMPSILSLVITPHKLEGRSRTLNLEEEEEARLVNRNLDWCIDSRATHHATANFSNLAIQEDQARPDQPVVGGSTGLPIVSSGSSLLCTPYQKFILRNILCALMMANDRIDGIIPVHQIAAMSKINLRKLENFTVNTGNRKQCAQFGSTSDTVENCLGLF